MKNVPKDKYQWFRLDNAALIYPAISNAGKSCVYRIGVNLTKEVDPDCLQQAVLDCKPRFPTFFVKLKKGLFWHYFESNPKDPIVKPESPYVNMAIDRKTNNDYLFTVFYYKNRISIEVFHSLGDGYGAYEFLKAVVYRYFQLLGYEQQSEGLVLTVDQAPNQAEIEDSFHKYYTRTPRGRYRVKKAYQVQGTQLTPSGDIGVIIGKLPASQLLKLVKQNETTLTQYLAALFTYCMCQADTSHQVSRPINLSIPVNLRRFYQSRSLRNFSLFFYTSIACNEEKPSFEFILEQIKEQFTLDLTKEKLQQYLNANVSAEKNVVFSVFPLFIKNIVLRFAGKYLGDKMTTTTISNGGNMALPATMKDLVQDFECNMDVGNNESNRLCVITYNDRMTISFSRAIVETEIERLFFTYLSERGIEIEIQSNLRENV